MNPDNTGNEDGEICNRKGCLGNLVFNPSLNCSCHISAPCGSCMEVTLFCPVCGWEASDEIDTTQLDARAREVIADAPRADPLITHPTTMTPNPLNHAKGLSIETILLSITVAHGPGSCGQVDDSSAYIICRELMKYNGVKSVVANVLYDHTKIEDHTMGCECGKCTYEMDKEAK